MARVPTHLIAYAFERKIESKLRSAKVPRPKAIVDDLVPQLIDEIPVEAFDPKEAWELGHLFYSGEVDEQSANAMCADLIEAHVNADKGIPLRVHFNSIGGSVYYGLGIIATIQEVQRGGRDVYIHVQGIAASMASVILQAATVRTIEPYAFLMIHEDSYDMPQSKMFEHRDALAFSERLDDACTALYTSRTGKPIEYYKKRFERRDWWLSATEALDEGLVDEIRVAPTYKRTRRKKAT